MPIVSALVWYRLMRAATRLDEALTMRHARGEAVEVLAQQFAERYRAIDAWLTWQRTRRETGGEAWYQVWRRRRRPPVDTTTSWINAMRQQEVASPTTRQHRDEWLGTADDPYSAKSAGHDTAWRGTIHDPFDGPDDVGKRRR